MDPDNNSLQLNNINYVSDKGAHPLPRLQPWTECGVVIRSQRKEETEVGNLITLMVAPCPILIFSPVIPALSFASKLGPWIPPLTPSHVQLSTLCPHLFLYLLQTPFVHALLLNTVASPLAPAHATLHLRAHINSSECSPGFQITLSFTDGTLSLSSAKVLSLTVVVQIAPSPFPWITMSSGSYFQLELHLFRASRVSGIHPTTSLCKHFCHGLSLFCYPFMTLSFDKLLDTFFLANTHCSKLLSVMELHFYCPGICHYSLQCIKWL